MQEIRVFMVDDEFDLVSSLAELFNKEAGFTADFETNPERVIERLNTFRPDILLMDKQMPVKNGLTVISEVRERLDYADLPIIMLTGSIDDDDVISSFKSGVDDFVKKPFNFEELKMRIQAVYKRSSILPNQKIVFEAIKMDVLAQTVQIQDQSVTLTSAEFKMLRLFLTNLHRVITREELSEEALGGSEHLNSRTIDVHINSLRKKLLTSGSLIKTVRGTGYKMTNKALKIAA